MASFESRRNPKTGAIPHGTDDFAFTREGKRAILNKLVEAELFETFADVKYTGTKRFGLDGGESMIPALEAVIKYGGQRGVRAEIAQLLEFSGCCLINVYQRRCHYFALMQC